MCDITACFCSASLFVAASPLCVSVFVSPYDMHERPEPHSSTHSSQGQGTTRADRQKQKTHIRRCAPDSEPRIISRFISQLWRNRIIPVLSLWIWVGRREKILNGKRKDLCFYSAEIECYREWIRSPVCETEEYSQGLFLDMVEWFQFSGTGIPSIWFHFIHWQRGQSWSASLLRNANQIVLLLCVGRRGNREHLHVW